MNLLVSVYTCGIGYPSVQKKSRNREYQGESLLEKIKENICR